MNSRRFVILWCLAVLVPVLRASAQQPPAIDRFLGAIAASQPSTYDAEAAAGLKSVRLAIFWNYLPPSGYVYNASDTLSVLQEAQARGFQAYGIINPPNNPLSVGWTPPNVSPATYQTFLRLTEDMARSYGDRIASWEIGNEVNQGFEDLSVYYPGIQYAALLRDSYFALLRGFQARSDYANLVASRGGAGFRMYAAGTAGTDLVWIDDVCRGLEQQYDLHPGEGGYIAGFSIHPFSSPYGPDDHVVFDSPGEPKHRISHGTLLQNIDWARFQAATHPRVPQDLFIGEYAWSTSYPANPANQVSEATQGVFVAQGFLEAQASRKISQAIWAWTFRDLPYGTWDFWDHTGALREDGSAKPAYFALKNVVDRLRGLSLQQNLGWMLPAGRMYLYGASNRKTLVFWSPQSVRVSVRTSAGAGARLLDHLGNVLASYATGPVLVQPNAAGSPRYLEVTGGTITEMDGIALLSTGEPYLPGALQSPTRWSRASSTVAGSSPSSAFDGSTATAWSSGAFAPGWVEVKLYNSQTVSALILYPAQLPAGAVDHRIDFAINNGPYQEVYRFAGETADDMKIVIKLPRIFNTVTHVRVRTLASPSWVAWKEIQAFR